MNVQLYAYTFISAHKHICIHIHTDAYTYTLRDDFINEVTIFHFIQLSKRYYLPTPPLGQDMTQGQFLSGV